MTIQEFIDHLKAWNVNFETTKLIVAEDPEAEFATDPVIEIEDGTVMVAPQSFPNITHIYGAPDED